MVGCKSHTVLRNGPKNAGKRGRRKKYPRVARRRPSSEVRNLLTYSPVFREQSWQRYRIKDTDKGPEVWEVKWAVFWRKDESGLADSASLFDRGSQRVDRGSEILLVQPRARRTESGHGQVRSRCVGCCEWPSVAGRSKVAFAKGRKNWAWTITKSAAGVACIGTST